MRVSLPLSENLKSRGADFEGGAFNSYSLVALARVKLLTVSLLKSYSVKLSWCFGLPNALEF